MINLHILASRAVLAIIVLVGLATSVAATDYYVDRGHASANNSNLGTQQDLPWLTVQHAANVAGAGDTVRIKAAVYPEVEIVAG